MNKLKIVLAVLILVPLLLAALLGLQGWHAGQAMAGEWTNFDAPAPALATTSRYDKFVRIASLSATAKSPLFSDLELTRAGG
jgi:hypothetical protein